jgi:hypothetical protein
MHVQTRIGETDCNNSPGPWVTIEGEITLGGIEAQLVFQNNLKGTHSATVTYSTNVVLGLGAPITIPKQPVRGGVGGNPYIWIQFLDASGVALGDEIFLGRCVQGLTLNSDFINQVVASTTVISGNCQNHPGPTITFGGNLTLSGLKARIIFRNNTRGTHTAESQTEVSLVINGSTVTLPKQPVLGGAGGNPLIWLQFLQDGTPLSEPIFLGRCNHI